MDKKTAIQENRLSWLNCSAEMYVVGKLEVCNVQG